MNAGGAEHRQHARATEVAYAFRRGVVLRLAVGGGVWDNGGGMATASHLRRLNQKRILEGMVRMRRASRAVLAREAGMSQPTVSRIVDGLLSREILMERPSVPDALAKAGRPSTLLELNATIPRFLALQVGVLRTRLAGVPLAMPEEDRFAVELGTAGSAAAWKAKVKRGIAKLELGSGIEGTVVSLPGVVDEGAGRVVLSPNLRWTESADFRSLLEGVVPGPVHFVQEIRALALGRLATVPGETDFLLVDLGSGVGAAAVLGSKLYSGVLPLSGEIGHTRVLDNRRVCGCGAVGCLETLVSRPGLLASSAEHGGPREWGAFVRSLEKSQPAWLGRSLEAAAGVIGAAVNVLGLRDVVLTGYVNDLPEAVTGPFAHAVKAGAMWSRFGDVSCRIARRHRLAGMVWRGIEETY